MHETFVPCPSCKSLQYVVKTVPETGATKVICSECQEVLFEATRAPAPAPSGPPII
jgi:hypothetical protein